MKRFFTMMFFTLIFSGALHAGPITIMYINGVGYAKLPYSSNMWAKISEQILTIYEFSEYSGNKMTLKNIEATDILNPTENPTKKVVGTIYKKVGDDLYLRNDDSRLYYSVAELGRIHYMVRAEWEDANTNIRAMSWEDIGVDEATLLKQIKDRSKITVIIKGDDNITRMYEKVEDNTGYKLVYPVSKTNEKQAPRYEYIVEGSEMTEAGWLKASSSGKGSNVLLSPTDDAVSKEGKSPNWNDKNIKEQLGKIKAGVVEADLELLHNGFLDALISNNSYAYYFKEGMNIINKLLTQKPSVEDRNKLNFLNDRVRGAIAWSNGEVENIIEMLSEVAASAILKPYVLGIINHHMLDLIIEKDREMGKLAAYSLMVALNKNDKLDMTTAERDDLKIKLQQIVADAGLDDGELFDLKNVPMQVYEKIMSTNLELFDAAVESKDNNDIEVFLKTFFTDNWKANFEAMINKAKESTNDLKAKAEMLNRMLALSVVLTYYVTNKEPFIKQLSPLDDINVVLWRVLRFGGEIINEATKFEYSDGGREIRFKFDKAKGEADKIIEGIKGRYKAY